MDGRCAYCQEKLIREARIKKLNKPNKEQRRRALRINIPRGF